MKKVSNHLSLLLFRLLVVTTFIPALTVWAGRNEFNDEPGDLYNEDNPANANDQMSYTGYTAHNNPFEYNPKNITYIDYHHYPQRDTKEDAMRACENFVNRNSPGFQCQIEDCEDPAEPGKWCWYYEKPEDSEGGRRYLRRVTNKKKAINSEEKEQQQQDGEDLIEYDEETEG